MPKSLTVIILAIALIFCGCRDISQALENNVIPAFMEDELPDVPPPAELLSFGLEYNLEESLNPLITKSRANTYMLRAVYDCLVTNDSAFLPKPALCESWEGDGSTFRLKLRQGVTFQDGSGLSAADVVYTLKYIMNTPGSTYYGRLAEVQRVSEMDGETVEIVLKKPNAFFVSLLEIPIVKENAIGKNVFVPNGTGAYSYQGDEEQVRLTLFEGYWNKAESALIDEVLLFDAPNDDMQLYNFESGNVDVQYISLADSSKMGAYGDFLQKELATLQLTYLAPNTKRVGLADERLGKAISMLLSRQEVVDVALAKHATPTYTPLHPAWGVLGGYVPEVGSREEGRELLQEMGKSNYSFKLLINVENEFKLGTANELSKQLSSFGIDLEIERLSWNEYLLALQNGNFDFYLGEVKMSPDMDASFLMATGGAANYGGQTSAEIDAAIVALYGTQSPAQAAADFCDVFVRTMPVIPLYFSNSTIIYKRNLQPADTCTDPNPYSDINRWSAPAS